MTIQDVANLVLHDDRIIITTDEGVILWRGCAAQYRGEVSEEKYHFNYITALSVTQLGIIVYPVLNEDE